MRAQEDSDLSKVQEVQSEPEEERKVVRHRARWSLKDEDKLRFLWGLDDLKTIAKILKRNINAIVVRAARLKLGPPTKDTKCMREFLRDTGYSESRVTRAIRFLGLQLSRTRRMDSRQKRQFTSKIAITEEQQEKILAYLSSIPDARPLYATTGERTQGGVWGVGRKPAACTTCGTSERPHCAKGLCDACYQAALRAKRSSFGPFRG